VTLKSGYSFLHAQAKDSIDGGLQNHMTLEWKLDLDGDGNQGLLKVKVKKIKSSLTKADKEPIGPICQNSGIASSSRPDR
jgi:hypothetical protein